MDTYLIFKGMPTLLSDFKQGSFDSSWPFSKELPPLVSRTSLDPLPFEQFNLQIIFKETASTTMLQSQNSQRANTFRLRKVKKITDCPHKNKKHYAKNMCSDCYSKKIKENKIPICGHPEKTVFARNLCLQCYTNAYRASKKKL